MCTHCSNNFSTFSTVLLFGLMGWGQAPIRYNHMGPEIPTIDYILKYRMSGRILIDRSLAGMGWSHRYITNSRQRLSMSEATCWSQCQTATTAGYCKGDLQWAATSVFFVEDSLKSFRCWCRYRAIISGAFQMTRLHQCFTSACRNSMQFFQNSTMLQAKLPKSCANSMRFVSKTVGHF